MERARSKRRLCFSQAPSYYETEAQQAVNMLDAAIHVTSSVTVDLTVSYDSTNAGGASAGPVYGQYETYTDVRAALIATAAANGNLAPHRAA